MSECPFALGDLLQHQWIPGMEITVGKITEAGIEHKIPHPASGPGSRYTHGLISKDSYGLWTKVDPATA